MFDDIVRLMANSKVVLGSFPVDFFIVKIEKILTVTYRTLLPKTTNFLKNGG